jgi:hypothetical protein
MLAVCASIPDPDIPKKLCNYNHTAEYYNKIKQPKPGFAKAFYPRLYPMQEKHNLSDMLCVMFVI